MASERKAIFITGAASGIGLATAKRFAGAGCWWDCRTSTSQA
ncbi:MAG: hypothetical protein WDM85_11230 [Caulobacteraceae bacterium]